MDNDDNDTVYIVQDRHGAILRAFLDKALADDYADKRNWWEGRSDAVKVIPCALTRKWVEFR